MPLLSCEQCRQRKTKCDKGSPCSACKSAGLPCNATDRARLPRGRSGRLRNANVALETRLARLEELLKHKSALQTDADGEHGSNPARPIVPDLQTNDEYIAADFWTALTREVTAVRDALETPDEGDDGNGELPATCEDHPTRLRPSTLSVLRSAPQKTDIRQAPGRDSRLDHVLFKVYRERVDTVFKPMIWPRVMKNLTSARSEPQRYLGQGSLQALKTAIHYMAICSLNEAECMHLLGQKQDVVLHSYRQATDSAIATARILEIPTVQGLQAFIIYLQALRTRRGHALNWTLLAVAVRLASALRLGKEDPTTLDFETLEIRRRLWYSICIMDTQATLDRGSAPMISASSLGLPPLNIDDVDCMSSTTISLKTSVLPTFTDMAFVNMTNHAMACHKKLCDVPCTSSQDWESWTKKLQIFAELELSYKQNYLTIDISTARPIEILTRFAAETILACTRLLLRRPAFRQQYNAIPPSDDFNPMAAATEVLERHLLFEFRELAAWAWKEWPPWYALAVALAELCRSPHGLEADRAFAASCSIFRRYACPPDDVDQGMLWKPIAKLLRRVTKLRSGGHVQEATIQNGGSSTARNGDVKLPTTGSESDQSAIDVPQVYGMEDLDAWLNENNALFNGNALPAIQPQVGSPSEFFDLNPEHGVSWLDWDALMHDLPETQAGPNNYNIPT